MLIPCTAALPASARRVNTLTAHSLTLPVQRARLDDRLDVAIVRSDPVIGALNDRRRPGHLMFRYLFRR